MNRSGLFVLVAVAAVLSAAAWWLGSRDQARYEAAEAPLLAPSLEARLADIDRVEIRPAEGDAFSIALTGGNWGLVERDGYPIDTEILRRELRKFAEARGKEAKTANAAYYPQLGVNSDDDAEAPTIQLSAFAGDESVAALVIGKPGKGGHYVRLADQAQSWQSDTRFNVPRTVPNWLQRVILEIKRDRLARITVTPASGRSYTLHRANADETNFTLDGLPEGREVQVGNINRLAAAISNLRLTEVARSNTGTDTGDWNRTVFETFDGLVITTWSQKPEDGDGRVRIEARYEAPAASEGNSGEETEGDAGDDVADTADVAAEAEAINKRVSGWTYSVSSYNATALNFAFDVLLKPLPEDES